MTVRIAGPRVLDPESAQYVSPQELTALTEQRKAERMEALRREVLDRRPTPWRHHAELRDRVEELERRLDALTRPE